MIPETGWGKSRSCSMYLPATTTSTVRNTAVEIGPVQVGDSSGGLRATTWTLRVDETFNVAISNDGFNTSIDLFTERGMSSASLTFDVRGYPVVAYELGGNVVVREFADGSYVKTELGVGSRPKVHLDLRSVGTEQVADVVVAYTISNKVYTRSQSQNYQEVYTGIRVPVGSYIASFGMTKDHRMQLSIVEAPVRRANGSTVAVGHENGPFVTIYLRDGDTFTKLDDVGEVPAGTVRSVCFSPDGQFMAVAHDFAPYVSLYMRGDDGVTFVKLLGAGNNPPKSAGRGVAYSPDGIFLCVVESNRPYVTFYKQRGERLLKMGSPSQLIPGVPYGVAFSPDGMSVAIAHASSPFITRYSLSPTNWFEKLPAPEYLIPGVGRGLSYSPDGKQLAVVHNLYPFVTIYNVDGDQLSSTTFVDVPPSDTTVSAAFSPDGTHLIVGGFGLPYINAYVIGDTGFKMLPNPASPPAGPVRGITFDGGNNVVMVAHQTYPFFTAYKLEDGKLHKQPLITPTPSNNAMSIAAF